MDNALSCAVCGDVLGVYEPVLVVAGASTRTTSLAREPQLIAGHGDVMHRGCQSSAEGRSASSTGS